MGLTAVSVNLCCLILCLQSFSFLDNFSGIYPISKMVLVKRRLLGRPPMEVSHSFTQGCTRTPKTDFLLELTVGVAAWDPR